MDYNQFKNLSCYEEFEMKCTLTGISVVDVLKEFRCRINDYYFFIFNDGIFNWFDLDGNHIEDPGILKKLSEEIVPKNLTRFIIPNGITHIWSWTFAYCESLKEITIPDSVTVIGDGAFYDCMLLKEITIPDNVTYIGNWAFSYCKSLTSVIIPDSVKSIGYQAFYDCESLKEVIFKGKTLKQVKRMKNYPFGLKDKSIIKCEKLKLQTFYIKKQPSKEGCH